MAIRAIRRQSLPTNWIPKEWLIAVFLPKQVLERANSEEDLPKASLETIQKSNMQSFKGKQFFNFNFSNSPKRIRVEVLLQ